MSCWLRQSTAVDVMLGPFLDETTGKDIESGLTITQPDIRLSKNGAAFAQKSAAQTLTHGENGWYPANLSTTDTNTVGVLVVAVHESGALPVWREFFVLPANVYDSLLGNDFLQIDVAQWLGATPTGLSSGKVQSLVTSMSPGAINSAAFGAGAIDAAATAADFLAEINAEVDTALADYDAPTFAELDARTDAIEADTQDIQARLPAALVSGRIDSSVGAMAANVLTASAVASGAIDNDALAADTDGYHAKVWVVKESTTTDHYGVAFFKNGQPVTTGITDPTIQVIKASDGTDLIASTALTEIGSLGIYKKDESTNKMTGGLMYFAKVQVTIDGSTRQWLQQIGRDSV